MRRPFSAHPRSHCHARREPVCGIHHEFTDHHGTRAVASLEFRPGPSRFVPGYPQILAIACLSLSFPVPLCAHPPRGTQDAQDLGRRTQDPGSGRELNTGGPCSMDTRVSATTIPTGPPSSARTRSGSEHQSSARPRLQSVVVVVVVVVVTRMRR